MRFSPKAKITLDKKSLQIGWTIRQDIVVNECRFKFWPNLTIFWYIIIYRKCTYFLYYVLLSVSKVTIFSARKIVVMKLNTLTRYRSKWMMFYNLYIMPHLTIFRDIIHRKLFTCFDPKFIFRQMIYSACAHKRTYQRHFTWKNAGNCYVWLSYWKLLIERARHCYSSLNILKFDSVTSKVYIEGIFW